MPNSAAASKKGRPYISAALLCEKVLHEQDGTLSAIRIVDKVTVQIAAKAKSKVKPTVQLAVLIAFKSGPIKGKHLLRVVPRTPSGRKMAVKRTDVKGEFKFPLVFESEEHGSTTVINLVVDVSEEGVYWFDVYLGRRVVTRIPLTVVHRVAAGPK